MEKLNELKKLISEYALYPMSWGTEKEEFLAFEINNLSIIFHIKKVGEGKFDFSLMIEDDDDSYETFSISGIKKSDDLFEYIKDKLETYIENKRS